MAVAIHWAGSYLHLHSRSGAKIHSLSYRSGALVALKPQFTGPSGAGKPNQNVESHDEFNKGIQSSLLSCSLPSKPFDNCIVKTRYHLSWENPSQENPKCHSSKYSIQQTSVEAGADEVAKDDSRDKEWPRLKWVEISSDITEAQKQAICHLPPKMTKRCKALMKQIICFSPGKTNLPHLLATWVKIMKPRRADWLSVLKELMRLDHPLQLQVAELALNEESFEADVRDFTKIIDGYAKQNRLQDAENTIQTLKARGFNCDQVILTALLQMYGKAGNLKRAEETFEEMKLLGSPLDKRAYGSMIMVYVRAGMTEQGERLLREMETQDIFAGREVYKAMLRAYSMTGDTMGAQRVFDAIQCAGITPDVKLCALLMNAYVVAGRSKEALSVFENLRCVGLEPSDKCVALMLTAYEKEKKLTDALDLLIDLEQDGVIVGKEASNILVGWFRRLGVVDEVELVLRQYAARN